MHTCSSPPSPLSLPLPLSRSYTRITRPPALKIQTIHTPHTTRPFSFNNKILSRHATLPHTIATKSHQLGAAAPFMPTTVPMERVIALSVLPNNPALLPAPPLCVAFSGMSPRGPTSVPCSPAPPPSTNRLGAGKRQRPLCCVSKLRSFHARG